MNNRYYQILYMVSAGGRSVCRHFLNQKGFSDELIDECITNGYILEIGHNDLGDPIYKITDAGRIKRDER